MAQRLPGGWRRNMILPGLITAGWMTATTALGQSDSRQVMVFDDGGGPRVLHFSQPDFRGLREPDYVRSDLPIFSDKLSLSETQAHIVTERLEAYLHAFKDLADETLPAPRGEMTALNLRGDGDGEHGRGLELHGGGLDDFVMDALEGEDGIAGLDIDVDDMGGGGAIAVTIQAGGPGMDTGDGSETELVGIAVAPGDGGMWMSDGGGGGDVMIAIESSGGAEIPDELRERLEAKAREMAERMQDMEFDEVDGAVHDGGMMFESIEDRQAHFDELAEQAKKFKSRKAVLGSQFVSDVQAQLSADQLQRWPSLERTLTRRKSLPKGRLDGEKTDLIDVFESLDPPPAAVEDLDRQFESYETSLHSALVARDAYLESSASDIDDAIHAGDMDKALSITDRAAALRVGVRNVNAQYDEVFVQQLEPEDADRFRQAVLRSSHPRIYRPTPTERAFAAAMKLPELDEDDKSSIAALEQAYRSERDALDTQIRQTVLRHQPAESRRAIEHVGTMMQGGGMGLPEESEDPIDKAYARRRDLDERYLHALHGLLTEAQIAQLPKASKRRGQPIIIRESGRNPF